MVEDTLFYSVEPHNGSKSIHVFGWIFCDTVEDPELNTYRLSEGRDIFFDIDKLKNADPDDPDSIAEIIQLIFNERSHKGDAVMGYKKACECFDNYIKEFSATELDLFSCNQDTPDGNYWFDMSDM